MDLNRRSTPVERVTLCPTSDLIGDVLRTVDPSLESDWNDGILDSRDPRVVVNGIAVPIVRAPWNRVDDFFQTLFTAGNERFFGGALPKCRLRWNRRFRRLAGRIKCKEKEIELSAPHFEQCGVGAMGVVLVHEMIHLALFVDKLPFGHTPEFKRRSLAVGLPGIYHELPLPTRLQRQRGHLYRCSCGREIVRKIKFRQARACGECCKRFAQGRFDRRFVLKYVGPLEANAKGKLF